MSLNWLPLDLYMKLLNKRVNEFANYCNSHGEPMRIAEAYMRVKPWYPREPIAGMLDLLCEIRTTVHLHQQRKISLVNPAEGQMGNRKIRSLNKIAFYLYEQVCLYMDEPVKPVKVPDSHNVAAAYDKLEQVYNDIRNSKYAMILRCMKKKEAECVVR